ncbi:3-deoxy-D-manno-octulosonic acid kinase [Cricetibacter osteomyelitidis]|uniref:3-deoxy-D-manno-octulosonic acid kinase n=1 Tax=Cricetibacter osteomyelitidis TaxID=1521931 RepID=A0A4R2T3G4_9PAST|nr:3-deoxy-D-manno-octulosonic acid kinase [Cricetibacter osteomyelitidis]TCP96535.1 3-deoxy-D-manno-octulosonic acid kinase [Cricetibacter osteomyelitidis]
MIEFQQENSFFLLNIVRSLPDQNQFFNADYWQAQHRILGSAKGRGTTWFIQSDDLFGMNTALRHYYRGGLFGKIVKDRYPFSQLNSTRSFAEFHLLNQLHQTGIPVPKPIGAKVTKGKAGICYQADILTQRIENAQDLTALLQQATLAQTQWQKIGRVIRQLHDLQICHTDLNAHNILVQENRKIWLIDFDKCGEKSGNFWKAENLQRLHRSFVKEVERMNIQFTEQNWQDLLAGYNFI